MTNKSHGRTYIFWGSLVLAFAVLAGAFGAHGLKSIVAEKYLETYKTGVSYQFYHGLALILIGLIEQSFLGPKLKGVFVLFVLGVLLFSFNCYLYAITQIKTFAMIVPIGGVIFVLAWLLLCYKILKEKA